MELLPPAQHAAQRAPRTDTQLWSSLHALSTLQLHKREGKGTGDEKNLPLPPPAAGHAPLVQAFAQTHDAQLSSIAGLAASVLQAPLGVVCLLDEPDRWLTGGADGAVLAEQLRPHQQQLMTCALALATDQIVAIKDTAQHELLKDAPFVAGPPGIRFFAGAPILGSSTLGRRRVLGALCVLNVAAHQLPDAELSMLAGFTDLAAQEAERRQATIEAARRATQASTVRDWAAQQDAHQADGTCNRQLLSDGAAASFAASRARNSSFSSTSSLSSCLSLPACKFEQLQEHGHVMPEVFTDVQLGSVLGQGSYGRVYKATWRGALVAVKTLESAADEELVCSNGSAQGALLEAVLSRDLSHPNIVSTWDWAMRSKTVIDGEGQQRLAQQVWIVQQYCDRGTLANGLQRGWLREGRRPGSAPNAIAILQTAQEIASAMTYLHSVDVVHGDLSSANVLLTSSARDHRRVMAQVSDFGLSCVAAHMQNGPNVGAVSYMPPELLEGGLLSKAVDVYSFGVLLWEMWMGALAWAGCPGHQVLHVVAKRKARLQVPQDVPAGLKDLIERCLSFDHTRRPSFEQVLLEVKSLLKAELKAAAGTERGKNSGYISSSRASTEQSAATPAARLHSKLHSRTSVEVGPSGHRSTAAALQSPFLNLMV